jgi:hypothetical protein
LRRFWLFQIAFVTVFAGFLSETCAYMARTRGQTSTDWGGGRRHRLHFGRRRSRGLDRDTDSIGVVVADRYE